jgi:anti-sigma factor ChrR (cupin superfamily)
MIAKTPGLTGENKLSALASRVVNVADLPWQPTRWEGISIKVLMEDEQNGLQTALVKWEPGATLPYHEHVEMEQTYVIEGSFGDEDGTVTAGNYVWRPAGSRHTATSKEGALTLAFFLAPNRFLEQE